MNEFYVTGNPRSRTAWLAVFLTGPRSMCIHEGPTFGRTHAEAVDTMADVIYRGVADPFICWGGSFYDVPRIAASPVILVKRDFGEVESSIFRTFNLRVPVPQLKLFYDETKERYASTLMEVKFEELDDVGVLREIWYHCFPFRDNLFPASRAKYLAGFNIQEDFVKARIRAKDFVAP